MRDRKRKSERGVKEKREWQRGRGRKNDEGEREGEKEGRRKKQRRESFIKEGSRMLVLGGTFNS